ncbi:hypothetical protein KJ830_08805, partial [bacterium]|nr:hypothetical protein [bacterium]
LKITPFVRYAAINNKKTQQCGMPSLLFLRFENQQKIVVGIKNFMLDFAIRNKHEKYLSGKIT